MRVSKWLIIRHFRYFWLKCKLLLWWAAYVEMGGPGVCINDADWQYLDDVWNGIQ